MDFTDWHNKKKEKKKNLKNMPHQEISGEKKTLSTVTCWY